MRPLTMFCVLVVCGTALAAEPKTPEDLQGVWTVTQVTTQGQRVPPEKFDFELHFTETQLNWRRPSSPPESAQIYDCFAVAGDEPRKVDLRSVSDNLKQDGRPILIRAIYEIDGDKLRICTKRNADFSPAEERPERFVSSAQLRTDLMVLQRKKAKP